jgi:DNA-binding response OmpR family regulator
LPDDARRILICDDDSALREAVRDSFRRLGFEVVAVADGRAALDWATTTRFDVLLLDVGLGPNSADGYEVCRELRRRGNIAAIIMLTARDAEEDAVEGLEAGADDYVVKPFRPAELRSRITAILRRIGAELMGGEVLSASGLTMDVGRREVRQNGRLVDLTFSEFEILRSLLAAPGRVIDRQQLTRAVWGDHTYRDPRAVDAHVSHLRTKLGDSTEHPTLILTLRGVGYRLAEL